MSIKTFILLAQIRHRAETSSFDLTLHFLSRSILHVSGDFTAMSSSSPFTQAPAREIYPLQNSELDIFLIPSVARQVRAFMNLQSCSARQAVIWLGDEMRKRLFECGPGQSIVRRCLRDRRLNMKEWHEKTLSWEYRYLHMEWTQQLSMVNSGGPIPKLITHTYQDFTRSVRLQRELEEREEHDRCVARCGKAGESSISEMFFSSPDYSQR